MLGALPASIEAQEAAPETAAAETPPVRITEAVQAAAAGEAPDHVNPWGRRPSCASLFLKSEWRLSSRQRACDWVNNRLFSGTAILGAAWSAGLSQMRDASSEEGDPFVTRFGRRFAQSAFKSTATYVGGIIAGEDPRLEPPYLVMLSTPRPRGVWQRTRHALAYNFVSYRCKYPCQSAGDIQRRPAVSRVLGAFASGYAAEVWTWDRETSHQRALRGAATAYGSTFVNALVTEFTPELTGFALRLFSGLSGAR